MKLTKKRPARHALDDLCTPKRRKAYFPALFYSLCTAIIIIILMAAFTYTGCSRPEQPGSGDYGTLTPDERYIVELYMKINDLEQNLHDNPVDSLKKWEELSAGIDSSRVHKALEELEKDPERWNAVFSRISELQQRQSRE
jgi:hypothetical protein